MLSKAKRTGVEAGLPDSKRLRANVASLYAANRISAQAASALLQDARASGAQGLESTARTQRPMLPGERDRNISLFEGEPVGEALLVQDEVQK